ncbi:MAG: phosphate ABC transporter permease PstA [Alphaproteobacteria bacterium]|nr:phosphate ABC transporter permease PstA [Alphaproteobacteria bacterium]
MNAAAEADVGGRRRKRRYAAERRFRIYGMLSIALAVGALCLLLGSMAAKGWSAFLQTYIVLEVELPAAELAPQGRVDMEALRQANYTGYLRKALRDQVPSVVSRRDRRALHRLLSDGAGFELRNLVLSDPAVVGRTLRFAALASDDVDQFVKGHVAAGSGGKISAQQAGWLADLTAAGLVERRFNVGLFTHGDSREPEIAGIWGAVVGSMLTMMVTLLLSFPLGVAAAVYLEEFAPKNRWTDLIEVNINNLAAVPSIVFGLLGLAVFLSFFGLPRSAPLVGGIVLALMTLPTIIIAGRAALGSVPPSIREAAAGMGASATQVVLHHVLPLAFPGILTGTIIGLARALGETAPLLMIGMVAFIVDIPQKITDPATVLPVQIYLWADSPERAFVERTAAATLVLLAFLILMNLAAVVLRRKFERRW